MGDVENVALLNFKSVVQRLASHLAYEPSTLYAVQIRRVDILLATLVAQEHVFGLEDEIRCENPSTHLASTLSGHSSLLQCWPQEGPS